MHEHEFTLKNRIQYSPSIGHQEVHVDGWTPSRLPSKCECGNSVNVGHALSCAKGGFPSLRHNEIREQLNGASANSQDGARLDVSANGVWGSRFQKTYFDMRVVFNPLTPSNRNQALAAVYRKHELEKKQAHQQRIQEVEHSSFTPLVLSTTGGMGNEATIFCKCLALLLAQKWDSPYSSTLCWLWCCLSYSLLRSSIQAIRSARSSQGHAVRSHCH